jgi:hypothetical protein
MGPAQEAWFGVNVWTSAKQQFIILTPGMLQEKVDEGQAPGVPSNKRKAIRRLATHHCHQTIPS